MTARGSLPESSLDRQLGDVYRVDPPAAHLAAIIDRRVATALERHRARRSGSTQRTPRRILLVAASVSLVAALAIAGGAAAQRVLQDGIVFVDGILFREEVVTRPGVTNLGQPFWGTDALERSPAEAAEIAAEKGYAIRWQVESRGGTESTEDDEITFTDLAPSCGAIAGGSVIDEGQIQLLVVLDDPSTPGSGC